MVSRKKYIYMVLAVVVVLFLGIFSLTFIHKISDDERSYIKKGLIREATAHFDNMVITRKWNAIHGGVFVNEKDNLQPNPYLKNNIKLDSNGNKMIKINPAWMTRQLSDLSNTEGNYYYKITSLNPINPINVPDNFEKKALKYFETHKDQQYYYEFNKKFDFIGSLKVEKSCLICHAEQGYKLGDIRGGIRVSIPTNIYNKTLKTINEQETFYSLVTTVVTIAFILLLSYIIHLLYIYREQREKIIIKDKLLHQAQNIAKLGYWELNVKNNHLSWSPEVYSIFQLDKESFQPSYEAFLDTIHHEDREAVNQAYQNSLETKLPYEITHRLKMADDSIKYVIQKCETTFDENNKPIKSMGTVQDITDIKMAHIEALQKDEIILAQSRHAAMGEMISMIAHQWRQPISVISMDANNILVDIELDNITLDALDAYANNILNQTGELSKTIDDFRNFFKPNQNPEVSNIGKIVEDTLKIVGKSLENSSIDLELEINDDKKIQTYPRKLLQVLINIIKNANDAFLDTKQKDKKIFISSQNYQNSIEIKICDNAGGIKEESLSQIFDPYFSTKKEKNGTGLGLYISKTIVEKHLQGTLTAENIESGACFRITLPYSLKID